MRQRIHSGVKSIRRCNNHVLTRGKALMPFTFLSSVAGKYLLPRLMVNCSSTINTHTESAACTSSTFSSRREMYKNLRISTSVFEKALVHKRYTHLFMKHSKRRQIFLAQAQNTTMHKASTPNQQNDTYMLT